MFEFLYNQLFPFCGNVLGFFSSFAFRRYYDVEFYLSNLFHPNATAWNYYNLFNNEYIQLPYNFGGYFENIPVLSDILDFFNDKLWGVLNLPVQFLIELTGFNDVPFVLGLFFSITIYSLLFGVVVWLFKLFFKRS